jgi:hypothetical protein
MFEITLLIIPNNIVVYLLLKVNHQYTHFHFWLFYCMNIIFIGWMRSGPWNQKVQKYILSPISILILLSVLDQDILFNNAFLNSHNRSIWWSEIGCHHPYFWNRMIFIFEHVDLGAVIRFLINLINQLYKVFLSSSNWSGESIILLTSASEWLAKGVVVWYLNKYNQFTDEYTASFT